MLLETQMSNRFQCHIGIKIINIIFTTDGLNVCDQRKRFISGVMPVFSKFQDAVKSN